MCGHSKKVADHQPGGELSLATESTGTLILNFPTSKTMRKNLCCLTHPAMVFYGNPS
jgi:hypothetical protein